MDTTTDLKSFYDSLSDIYSLRCIHSVLAWDQGTYMPPQGADARGRLMEYVSRSSHAKITDPAFARIVDQLYEERDSLSIEDGVNVREWKKRLDKERKVPEELVAELAQTGATSYSAWVKARPANDFATMRPYLEKIVDLNRRYCDYVGYEAHPYNAMLDDYEPGMRLAVLKPLLLGLAEELRKIIPEAIERSSKEVLDQGRCPEELQYKLGMRVAKDLGFSFESGRLDKTAHPFMATIGSGDFRITNRYDKTDFIGSVYGTIHETGHALYEMGLLPEHRGTPMGEAASCGIHESQSRLWENPIGTSREFCEYLNRVVREVIPEEIARPTAEQIYRRLTQVQRSPIRTDADEVTYCQHVVVRMLLEEALMAGEMSVAELPDAWNDYYERYLGIRPTDYKNGLMQDSHWYVGSMGYFPSYALGNLYNAMMMEAALAAMPDLYAQVERGEFSNLLAWLKESVHRHGMRYNGQELIKNITGKELSWKPFVSHLKRKYLAS